MYFLIASGLSLIYGLMGVLNFAHGALHHRRRVRHLVDRRRRSPAVGAELLVGAVFGIAVGAVARGAVEFVLIRPLYRRPIEQVLVTVGLALALARWSRGSGAPTRGRSRFRPG